MAAKPEYSHYLKTLEEMKKQDEKFYQGDDHKFRNFPESRHEHHQPQGFWAGEEQHQFGVHRRGPTKS